MSPKRVALGQEAIEKLKIAQSCLAEAYGVLVKSGLSHRNAKSLYVKTILMIPLT